MLKKHNKTLKWILLTTVAIIVIVIVGGIIAMPLVSDHYRELFSQIHPGMTKNQIKEIVGDPVLVDTSGLKQDFWALDAPSWFSERPNCYFAKGDSILVEYIWEGITIDTSLVIDSTVDSH